MAGHTKPTMNTRELVFALVGAAGTDLDTVARVISEELRTVKFRVEQVRLSSLVSELPKYKHLQGLRDGYEDVRIEESMKAGNDMRRTIRNGDAVVRLAISAIRRYRQENEEKDPDKPLNRTAYILNSLKHPDEAKTLRRLYGDALFLISIYAPKHQRIERLSARIARSYNRFPDSEFKEKATKLIETDEKEVGDNFGQNVRDVFPLADLFASQGDHLHEQIQRFIHVLFGHPFITPSSDEYGLFHAKAAALRSADLSRQVGAVITTPDGEILAAGCNEVPKAGGGSVWMGAVSSEKDYRDFRLGHDTAAIMKYEMVAEVFDSLKKAKWLIEEKQKKSVQELTEIALFSEAEPIFKENRISNIIEYGRIVHAEMSAISEAARRGVSIRGSTLYCTTFPCHMCARHIIASGISRVVYVEPYPKSMAKDLYRRSIQVDADEEADDDAVRFDSFVGIAPEKYFDLFPITRRKDARGYAAAAQPGTEPRLKSEYPAGQRLELGYVSSLSDHDFGLSTQDVQETEGEMRDDEELVGPAGPTRAE